jgi:hypothetical protein
MAMFLGQAIYVLGPLHLVDVDAIVSSDIYEQFSRQRVFRPSHVQKLTVRAGFREALGIVTK